MADSIREVNFLRKYYTTDAAMKDKDFLKNESFKKYESHVGVLFSVPAAFQVWQLGLVNGECQRMYRRVRGFKIASFTGAVLMGAFELSNLKKEHTYYDRFYPETTELQRTLLREAAMLKESQYTESSVDDKLKVLEDPKAQEVYRQFYQLAPQTFADRETNPNAPDHKEHW